MTGVKGILLLICTCLILQVQISYCQPGIITTIAGTDTSGFSGDGGPAINCKLKSPYRIAMNKHGDIYIADSYNNRVRKINSTTGSITTVAGNGTIGSTGDGGQATAASFDIVSAICLDTMGNIFVLDEGNGLVRKVAVTTGIITTVAGNGTTGSSGDGGPATDASLNQPVGICVDKYGNVFIADWGNSKIRKVNTGTGIISTIAGDGTWGYSGDGGQATTAKLNGPLDIVIDDSDNVYIADQFNHSLRKIDATTGIINTIAGSGTAGFSGDGGPASMALLNQPTGLFIDDQNNLLIAEYGNGTVRKINKITGTITTIAGTGMAGYGGDGGPATNAQMRCSDVLADQNNNLIIADYENNRIRKIVYNTSFPNHTEHNTPNLFPNPTTGVITVNFKSSEVVHLSILSILRHKVYETTYRDTRIEVDLSEYPPGTYFLFLQSGQTKYTSTITLNNKL